MHPVLIILLSVLGMAALLWVLVLLGLARFTMRPWRIPLYLSARTLGMPQESVEWQSADGVLIRGWWMVPERPQAVGVFCHGYSMNRAEGLPLAKMLFDQGVACLVFDFRAHGSSRGQRSTIGWEEQQDVATALNHARRRFPGLGMFVWGSSMGGVATVFALTKPGAPTVEAVILDSPYATLLEANRGWWRTFLGKWGRLVEPVWWFTRMLGAPDARQVTLAEPLSQLPVPALMLYGDQDLMVPMASVESLRAVAQDARFEIFQGAGHSQPRWVDVDRYDALILEFLRDQGLLGSNPGR